LEIGVDSITVKIYHDGNTPEKLFSIVSDVDAGNSIHAIPEKLVKQLIEDLVAHENKL
jgi:hypothetical protein